MNHVGQALCIAATIPVLFVVAYVNEKDRDVVRVDQRPALQASLIGKCFDNGIGTVGKVFQMDGDNWGMLAFGSGATGYYRVTDLQERTCPPGWQSKGKGEDHGN